MQRKLHMIPTTDSDVDLNACTCPPESCILPRKSGEEVQMKRSVTDE
jgi:hypothetical protein